MIVEIIVDLEPGHVIPPVGRPTKQTGCAWKFCWANRWQIASRRDSGPASASDAEAGKASKSAADSQAATAHSEAETLRARECGGSGFERE